VLIDVRSLEEYAAGHPEDAYNVPYPRVAVGQQSQDPAVLYWEVYDIVKGRMDTPIMLLCRTGSRSVDAGNILANPDSKVQTMGLEPFTNVFNIWEGFVGNLKYAYVSSTGSIFLDENGNPVPLDLDNDGEVSHTADYADVYEEVTDANSDKDGWRNFQGLPWTTKIRRPQAYMRDPRIYDDLLLTPVE
jgi:rhodanese-related sulfurtransferase